MSRDEITQSLAHKQYISISSAIKSVIDRFHSIDRTSGTGVFGIRVTFKNGYALSIISGELAYVSPNTPFEIAILNSDMRFCGELLDDDDAGNDVVGECDTEKVCHYIRKTAGLEADHEPA